MTGFLPDTCSVCGADALFSQRMVVSSLFGEDAPQMIHFITNIAETFTDKLYTSVPLVLDASRYLANAQVAHYTRVSSIHCTASGQCTSQ